MLRGLSRQRLILRSRPIQNGTLIRDSDGGRRRRRGERDTKGMNSYIILTTHSTSILYGRGTYASVTRLDLYATPMGTVGHQHTRLALPQENPTFPIKKLMNLKKLDIRYSRTQERPCRINVDKCCACQDGGRRVGLVDP